MEIADRQSLKTSCRSSRWNKQPIFFKGYMGFTNSGSAGFDLLIAEPPPPRVLQVELCKLADETAVTLLLEDECSRAYLGRQASGLFAKLKQLQKATIRIHFRRRIVEEYSVAVNLAKF